jgi:hypothetical protein
MSEPLTQPYLDKIKDPKVFGPGTWNNLHIQGRDANTYAKKLAYIRTVELVLQSLWCGTCREDSLAYLKEHPLTLYWNIIVDGEDVGMFYWSVDFHNWVNRKLGKPQVPRDIAYRFYRYPDEALCTEGCGEVQETRLESLGFAPY